MIGATTWVEKRGKAKEGVPRSVGKASHLHPVHPREGREGGKKKRLFALVPDCGKIVCP